MNSVMSRLTKSLFWLAYLGGIVSFVWVPILLLIDGVFDTDWWLYILGIPFAIAMNFIPLAVLVIIRYIATGSLVIWPWKLPSDPANVRRLFKDVSPEFYAAAEDEVNKGVTEKGLWAIALVDAGGNEEKRKARYIQLRAKELCRRNEL